jgi:hypothetical protein
MIHAVQGCISDIERFANVHRSPPEFVDALQGCCRLLQVGVFG